MIFRDRLTRRAFLKKTGMTTLGMGFGLAGKSLINGCATAPIFESKDDVAQVEWDSNPAIPVPQDGCYFGWHKEIIGERPVTTWHLERASPEKVLQPLRAFRESYEYFPSVYSFTDKGIYEGYFPANILDQIYSVGAIPLIRYYCSSTFENVVKGNHDKHLGTFAQAARGYGKPFFLTPYPEVNINDKYKYIHVWGGESGTQFQKAWKHMHHIFQEEGANEYTVWGLHLIGFGPKRNYSGFAVDSSTVDWVGFSIYNLERETSYYGGSGLPISFSSMINDGYAWAVKHYPTKPICLLEFGSSNTRSQARWIRDAYRKIEQLPRIKLAVYYEYSTWNPVRESTNIIDDDSVNAFKNVVKNPYYIKSLY